MNQLKRLFLKLTIRQRVTLLLAALLAVGAIVGLSRWNKERDFKPLFTGLAADDAGTLVSRLRESAVDYRLNDNGSTILVPSAKVAEVRLQMAAAGLPKTGRIGFELFDKTNFGTTDFAEQVNYHRALEGELERTVMSLAAVEQARVHITFPKDSVFLESRQPAKASVVVKLRPGQHLSPQNVVAVCHLAASAVEGLSPDAVSVLDMMGNLLSRPRRTALAGGGDDSSDAALEYRQSVERDVVNKINATLEPLLGADKFRAGVSVDCDFTSGEQSEESYDPSRSVMVTSQRTEDGPAGTVSAGVPGTATNLPHPTARPSSGSTAALRRTENISYQSSRTVKRLRLPQGTIKRMSLSILVDHVVRWEGSGARMKRVIEPPSPEKLKVIHDLVAGATGLVADRDQLVVESFPFEHTLNPELLVSAPAPAAPQSLPGAPPWLRQLIEQKGFPALAAIGGGALLALVLGALFLIMRARNRARVEMAAELAGGYRKELAGSAEAVQHEMEARLAEQAAQKARQAAEVLASFKLPAVTTQKTEVLAKHIVEETKKDPQAMAHVVRSWLNGPDN